MNEWTKPMKLMPVECMELRTCGSPEVGWNGLHAGPTVYWRGWCRVIHSCLPAVVVEAAVVELGGGH